LIVDFEDDSIWEYMRANFNVTPPSIMDGMWWRNNFRWLPTTRFARELGKGRS